MTPFNDNWDFQRLPAGSFTPVRLPHDAMLHEGRRANAPSGTHGAFFLGGRYHYLKRWVAPSAIQGKRVFLLFEGVYRHSTVRVNGHDVGGCVGGYDEFEVRIDQALEFGEENLIEVLVDNEALPGARWYTGSGLYRPVWLRVVDPVHLLHDGLRFRTLAVDGSGAHASVELAFANVEARTLDISLELDRGGSAAASAKLRSAASLASVALVVPAPLLWSAERPYLYDLVVRIQIDGRLCDERRLRVGLRTIELSGRAGLRVNGDPVLLRGGNIHHDNGVLGAATFRDAEYRRVRVLKATGFNAIRSAHNPISRALLDACDELGLYVMDELYDGWYDHKTEHDDAPHFAALWPDAAAAMVAKDRNHPCVLFYSIGNENSEPASAYGVAIAQRMVEHLRALDPDRAVTLGVNLMSAALAWPVKRKGSATEQPAGQKAPNMNSAMVNVITNQFTRLMKLAPRLRRTDAVTRDLFAAMDVAGYNYGTVRYERDGRLHPDRVIIGTETVPGDISQTWDLVERVPNVVGDFMWAGWDYIGETGIGTWEYGATRQRLYKPYPYITAGCGAIDITGLPGAVALHAQHSWGLLQKPSITVRPPDIAGLKPRKTAWRSTDAVPSWAWKGCEGKPAQIEVISRDDEIELQINGRSLGRKPAGLKRAHVARFSDVYQPGEITAIAYLAGVETGRSVLRSATAVQVRLRPETLELVANGQDLVFVWVELADALGVIEMCDDAFVKIEVQGPGALAGFGSAAPFSEESFCDDTHTTYRGRALLVIRAGLDAGSIRVIASSQRHGSAAIDLQQTPNPPVH